MAMYRILPNEHRLQPFRSIEFSKSYLEQHLENWLEQNPDVLTDGEPILIIGRQVNTGFSGTLDLMGLDSDGRTIIIELKRAPTPRDIIAQALEYSAWIATLDQAAIRQLAQIYLSKQATKQSLEEAWRQAFTGATDNDEISIPQLNDRQRIIIVVEGGNERVTAVIRYLRSLGVDITLLEYRYYQTESGEEILDIEQRIGREQVTVANAQSVSTIESLLSSWSPSMTPLFYLFRDCLLAEDEQLNQHPTKTGISFYKVTRNGRVFVCYFNGSPPKPNPYVAFRVDSLQDRLDLQFALTNIKRSVGPDVQLNQGGIWWTMHFPATEEHTQRIANIIVENILSKLE